MTLAVFRLDSSKILGSGHVQRCLTLAGYLKQRGMDSVFICKELEGHFGRLISNAGYKVYYLDHTLDEERDAEESLKLIGSMAPVQLLIIDDYVLSERYEKVMRKAHVKILVIDDLMNRSHDCDYLLDQNYRNDYSNAYNGLVPPHCKKWLGPGYALMRPQFFERRDQASEKKSELKRIFVFFGGSDPTGETLKFIKAVKIEDKLQYHVLLSKGNRFFNEILAEKNEKFILHIEPENIAEIMEQCDFYVGSGGTITWERMCMKLSGLIITVADNQIPGATALAQDQLHFYVGKSEDVDYKIIPGKILDLEKNSLPLINQQIQKYNAIFSRSALNKALEEIISGK